MILTLWRPRYSVYPIHIWYTYWFYHDWTRTFLTMVTTIFASSVELPIWYHILILSLASTMSKVLLATTFLILNLVPKVLVLHFWPFWILSSDQQHTTEYHWAWHWCVNSLRPRDAYMHHQTRPSLVQIMACHLFGAKPLSKPMLHYCQMDPLGIYFREILIYIQ